MKKYAKTINSTPIQACHTAYGISRSLQADNTQITIDFGKGQEILYAIVGFKNSKLAQAAFAKGIRFELIAVANPEGKSR